MGGLGAPELLIVLLIIIVLFGASRIAGVGAALGNSVRDFRKAMKDGDSPAAAKSAGDERRMTNDE